jgi:hypothetical protein
VKFADVKSQRSNFSAVPFVPLRSVLMKVQSAVPLDIHQGCHRANSPSVIRRGKPFIRRVGVSGGVPTASRPPVWQEHSTFASAFD